MNTSIGVTYSGKVVAPTTVEEIEAAYLEDQVFKAGGYNAPVGTIGGPYSMAVWQLMFPSSVHNASNGYSFAPDPAAVDLILEAETAVANGTWNKYKAARYGIFVPYDLESSQRFGIISAVDDPNRNLTVNPEPSSFILFGTGVGFVLWRRARGGKSSA